MHESIQTVFETEYNQWDLYMNQAIQEEDQRKTESELNEEIFVIEETENVNSEVFEHFQKYKESIIRDKDSNLVRQTVKIGDHVLIKKDFDKNPNTKRAIFESFYENSIYIVANIPNNNMLELTNFKIVRKK